MRHQGRALKIISAVVHPLWLDEFYEVASVEISDTTVSPSETINSVNDLLGCYGNLVYLHKNHCTSHFVYYSIRQFFRGDTSWVWYDILHLSTRCSHHLQTLASPYSFTLAEASLELGQVILSTSIIKSCEKKRLLRCLEINSRVRPLPCSGKSLVESRALPFTDLRWPEIQPSYY